MERTWRPQADAQGNVKWWFSSPWTIGAEYRAVGSRTVVTYVLYRDNREQSRHATFPLADAATARVAARNGRRRSSMPYEIDDVCRNCRAPISSEHDGTHCARCRRIAADQERTEALQREHYLRTRARESSKNPGRTLPAVVERCTAHVAPKLKGRGKRAALSGAIAICTASAQKRGVLKRGTRTLTAKGKRAERSARRRKGYREDVRAVGALARGARGARESTRNGASRWSLDLRREGRRDFDDYALDATRESAAMDEAMRLVRTFVLGEIREAYLTHLRADGAVLHQWRKVGMDWELHL